VTLLALDLGTNTGFALEQDGATEGLTVVSGTWVFKPGRFEGGGMRYLRFAAKLDEMHAAVGISRVAFEEVRAHKGCDAAHVYGGLMGQLTAWCEKNGIPYEGIPVGTIKKFATGKGNANKAAMIVAVEKWGYHPEDDNEADALALLHFVKGWRP
jgi:Holliday junction resolvasome RuvABC endonuclease subunit